MFQGRVVEILVSAWKKAVYWGMKGDSAWKGKPSQGTHSGKLSHKQAHEFRLFLPLVRAAAL